MNNNGNVVTIVNNSNNTSSGTIGNNSTSGNGQMICTTSVNGNSITTSSGVSAASNNNNNNNNLNMINNAMNEYVKQELRAVVGARQQTSPRLPPMQLIPGQQVTAADLEALGLTFEMPVNVDNDVQKWNVGPDINMDSSQSGLSIRANLDGGNNMQTMSGEKSLLQKLLQSETT